MPTMPISAADRARLDDAMDARRADLGLTWREVATLGGVSYETLRAARKGKGDIATLTKAAIERGLQWAKGSVVSVLDGGLPVEQDGAVDPDGPEVQQARRLILSASVEEFVARFRGAEEVYLQNGDREGADRWLVNALLAREEAIKAETTNRDAS